MSNYEASKEEAYVTVANGHRMLIKGKGTVQLITKVNNQERYLTLKEVLYVPELDKNLISVGIATQRGMKAIINRNGVSIYDIDGEILLEGCTRGRLLFANVKLDIEQATLVVEQEDENEQINQTTDDSCNEDTDDT